MDQFFNKPNNVPVYQKIFQVGSGPVFLRGKSDRFVYRSAMVMSVCGIGISLYGIYLMATGRMKDKKLN